LPSKPQAQAHDEEAEEEASPAGGDGGCFSSFRTLLENVTQDPAMLLWLDGADNTRTHPNENYSREVQPEADLRRGLRLSARPRGARPR
jgi:Protein of unknown function (DUF1800)